MGNGATFKKTHSRTVITTAVVARARFMTLAGAHAGPTDEVIGVSETNASSNQAISLILAQSALVEAAEAISAGQNVGPALDGSGRAAVSTTGCGKAMSAAVAAGDTFEVELFGLNAIKAAQVSALGSILLLKNFAGQGQYSRLIGTGDSISSTTAAGTGVVAADMYASKLQADYAGYMSFVNGALPGAGINGYWQDALIGLSLSANDIIFGLHGFNSLRYFGPNPQALEDYRLALEAFLAWCAIPESAKQRVVLAGGSGTHNSAVTSSGTWANFAAFGKNAEYSSSAGASQTFSVTGDTVYVWYMRQSGAAGSQTVTIDGVVYGLNSSGMSYSPNNTGTTNWEAAVMRFGGLAAGAHTVVVAAGSASTTVAIAAAGFTRSTVVGPAVISGNCLRMNAAGYALGAGTTNANDPAITTDAPAYMKGDGGVLAFNQQWRRAIESLRDDGLLVIPLDVSSQLQPSTNFTADNIHPNPTAHTAIKALFEGKINQLRSLRA